MKKRKLYPGQTKTQKKKKLLLYTPLLFTLFLWGCSSPESDEVTNSKVDHHEMGSSSVSEILHKEPAHEETKSRLLRLKELVYANLNKEKAFNDPVNSLVYSHSDSISEYSYIVNLFPLKTIDSIEFYPNKHPRYKSRLDRLLILYFNNKSTAKQELDSLDLKCRNRRSDNMIGDFRAIESMFKPGGMAFEIDGQLVVYPVNTCGPGYISLQRIDTLIHQNVFDGDPFIRLHSGCGMGPFKRLDE